MAITSSGKEERGDLHILKVLPDNRWVESRRRSVKRHKLFDDKKWGGGKIIGGNEVQADPEQKNADFLGKDRKAVP